MSKFEYARKYSTDKIIAKAFKEYTEQVATNYSNMMALMADINDISIENPIMHSREDIQNAISDAVEEVFINNDININDTIILSDGAYNLHDVCKSIVLSNYNDDMGETSQYDTKLSITNLQGQASGNFNTVEDLFTDINTTYHATICTTAVAQAYALGNNVSEQVQLARDYVGQKFSSSYSDISGYLEDSVNAIKNGASVTEWISGLLKTSGIDDAAENENFTFNNSDSYKFTGATPASALCWSTTKDAIVSTVKVAAKAVKSIVGGILKLGKKLFNKVKDKVVQMTVNPYDLEEINKHSDGHTIDGYADQKKIYFDFDNPDPSAYSIYLSAFADDIEVNKYIHTDYFCCEEMLSIQVPSGYKQGFRDPFVSIGNITLKRICQEIYSHRNSVSLDSINDSLTLQELLGITEYDTIHSGLQAVIIEQSPGLLNGFMYEIYRKTASSLQENQDNVDFINFLNDHSVNDLNSDEWTLVDLGRLALIACYLHSSTDMFLVCITRYKPIDYKAFKTAFEALTFTLNVDHYEISTNDVISIFDYLVNSGDIYADCGSSEVDLYNSFVLGYKASNLLRNLLLAEAEADINGTTMSSTIQYYEFYIPKSTGIPQGFRNYANNSPFTPYDTRFEYPSSSYSYSNVIPILSSNVSISNKDFFYVAIGTAYDNTYTEEVDLSSRINFNMDKVLSSAQLFSLLHTYKRNNPLDYEFWPYEKENSSWNDAQFRIKADSENKNYASAFIVAALVIVAAVVIGIKAKKIIRKKLNTAYIKQQAAQAQAVEAARNGTLSDDDMKQFNKSKKRLNRLNKLFGNSATPASSTTSGLLEDISATQNASESKENSSNVLEKTGNIIQQNEDILLSNQDILKYIIG